MIFLTYHLKKYSTGIIFIFALLQLVSCSQTAVKSELEAIPDSAEALSITTVDKEKYRQGITLLNQGKFPSASRIFNEFIVSHPKLAGAYSNLALIYYKQAEFNKALEFSSKAITLNPSQSQAYNIRAQSFVKSGKIHEAKDDYLKAIELKPEYANAQYNLALLYDIYLQDIQLSIQHYEIYMKLTNNTDERTREWINHLKGTLANG